MITVYLIWFQNLEYFLIFAGHAFNMAEKRDCVSKKVKKQKDENNFSFKDFCDETSLEGWKYLNLKSPIWKSIWFILLTIAVCISSYNFYIATREYLESATITTISSTMASLTEITFPSVYICNSNQVCMKKQSPLLKDVSLYKESE